MPHEPLPILTIGAGVAGLTLAQGLRLRSIAFRLSSAIRVAHFPLPSLPPLLQSILRDTAAERHSFALRYVDIKKLDYLAPGPVDRESMPLDTAFLSLLAMSAQLHDFIRRLCP
ncbi:hypothetical protein F4825DRAFT_29686 [Nemania diffusa]|nr:hypothetical protein F4825DRAFT_29686 [Nemania diffusa]